MSIRVLLLLPVLFIGGAALAAEDADAPSMTAEEFEASLDYKQGTIALPGGRATLDVPPSFRYLGPEDAQRVLVDAWGNPPGAETLGMLFPANVSPLQREGWGVVIDYSDDGHVSDDDASTIDFDELLADMQAGVAERNEERTRQGYEPLTLVGWAEPPHYDQGSHKLYWARHLRFGDAGDSTLNYSIRVLGREGVLVLNAVAGMDQLELVKSRMQDVLGFANFNEGNRYADFDSSTDKAATYGLAALIGGAVAAKTGLLAKLGVLLLAAKKFIVIILVAIGALVTRLFRRKT
jgi:uncharacterized membrane-anchored protein